ncbi:feruloyl-CoA synthase [Fertoebacter nigrum]|uniref:Feruloyl-CoA synthase n=1 Tax=Fertoeibacter niger TaxID=2656921 RepID=A0A8X8H0V8_9RHOB|nr:feruloyl-CoA synthase [Fertoeibacter niger]NUB45493.1 feruloyl-CoA synthase [Fertoeibacter niger]
MSEFSSYTPHRVIREDRADGSILLRSGHDLGPVARNTGDWLHHWAAAAPDRVFVAERSGEGWREEAFAATLAQVQAIGAVLVGRGLGPDTPIVMLSGNGVDHLLLSLAAQYVGVPVVPLAEQYALIPEAYGRLIYVVDKVRPAMAYVTDAALYAGALALPQLHGMEVVASVPGGAAVTPFADLLRGDGGVDLAAAHARVGPDTLAKILFTSGSTSDPKGVLTTHGMMCANQAQMAAAMPFLSARPPKILDWLPWNHVFGGSHNVNMMLCHGGSLYIDDGKPTKAGFAASLRNLREHPGSLSFNVPVGFAMLVAAMEADAGLRRAYFGGLDLIFYAGASLPQDVWEKLERFAMAEQGRLPLMASSWGMTETAPAAIMVHEPIGRSGVVGVPLPGVTVKLLPDADMRCELRVTGPNVMAGYYADPVKSAEAFDDEGFLVTGDALKFLDPGDAARGLVFDGRVSEDFKLMTGTWVQAGALRLEALAALAGVVQDVVICGHDRGEVGLLVFPLAGHGQADGDDLRQVLRQRLAPLARQATGSARCIARALVLAEPPRLDLHEVTDKGSLNIRRILTRRADMVDRLYDNDDPAVIRVLGGDDV